MTSHPRKRKPALRLRFTEKNVHTIPRRLKQFLAWDVEAKGLAILISPQGARSFRACYYFNGSPKVHWRHLGRVGEMTLDEARRLTRETRGASRRGDDPRDDNKQHADSFKAALESYVKHHQIGKKANRSAEQTGRFVLARTTDWHVRPVSTIRLQEINHLLWHVRDGDPAKGVKPAPYAAVRLYSHLRHFFSWCVKAGTIKASPMLLVERPWDGAKARDLPWFKGEEANNAIRSLWRAADEIGGDKGRFVKLLMLTGKRKSALHAMKWEKIDAT